jgi:hypothetical protein
LFLMRKFRRVVAESNVHSRRWIREKMDMQQYDLWSQVGVSRVSRLQGTF